MYLQNGFVGVMAFQEINSIESPARDIRTNSVILNRAEANRRIRGSCPIKVIQVVFNDLYVMIHKLLRILTGEIDKIPVNPEIGRQFRVKRCDH